MKMKKECKGRIWIGELKYKTIYVSNGDSIWNIAKEEIKENSYFYGKSVKEVVYNIKNTNNLCSSEIYIGQKLLVPTK